MNSFQDVIRSSLSEDQKDLLVTLMARMVLVDGRVDHFEVSFLRTMVGDHVGSDFVAGLRRIPPLFPGDISRRAEGNEEIIYLICALLSCVDEHVDDREQELLRDYAQALRLSAERKNELDSIARRQILDDATSAIAGIPGFTPEKCAAVEAVAERLRATRAEKEEALRRHGLSSDS